MFEKVEKIMLSVEGMSCQHCVKRVETAIKSVKGVKSVSVSLENNSAVVSILSGKTDAQAIITALSDAGYPSHEE